MTAITPEDTGKLTGLVSDRVINTNKLALKVVYAIDADAAAGETYDLSVIDPSLTGLIGAAVESVDGAAVTARSAFSGTTITLSATTAGSYKSVWFGY